MNLIEKLPELPLFQDFSRDEIKTLAGLMQVIEAKEKEVIFDEKSPTSAVYFILSGRVSIYKMLHGAANFLTILEKGDLFGEVAFVDQKARSASASALDDVKLAKFAYEHFEVIQKQAPVVGMKLVVLLMRELARKFRAVNAGLDLKSLEHTINELIVMKQQVKVTTSDTEYICSILYFDRVSNNPFLKIDYKSQTILLPFSQIKSIILPNQYGKF
ncbi:MAG: cyclic nucleotide-binding domain-containing protein [Candidatus Riflebacteria bacterium]|nr:cyclic nucleotide-binding domain-containing protein [Candidatus Riflebacteria bacterium]